MTLPLASFVSEVGPAVSIGLCLLAIPLIASLRRRPNPREAASLAIASLNFLLVLGIYFAHRGGETIQVELLRVTRDLRLAFRVDDLGLIFALTASGLWILNTLYSIGYMRAHDEHKQTRFYICFAAAIAAAMGAAFASNLFTLFVFYEMLTLVTYPLVIHAETPEAKAGARRYLIYLLGLSIAFQLPALFLTAEMGQQAVANGLVEGALDFHPRGLLTLAGVTHAGARTVLTISTGLAGFTFVLFLMGVAKAALMPFHSWLPAAMVAPTPVSALLHAVAVVKAGVFTVSRVVFHVFGVELLGELGIHEVLVFGACFTIVVASMIALAQDNLKRRLAYSTISQLSYVLLGIGMLQGFAQTGGLAHIGFHAVSKITLFFCAGAIMVAAHKKRVSELDGIGRRMPITMGAFTIGALSMIGLPPAAGLVGKWYLGQGAGVDGRGWVLACLVASTMLNAGYFLPIVWRAFFKPSPDGEKGMKEAPWPMVVALGSTALLTILFFVFPDVVLDLARAVVEAAGGAS